MSYYDEGFDEGYAQGVDPRTINGPHLPDFSVWQGKSIPEIFCMGGAISPLLLAGLGVVGYFISPGKWKWFSLLSGVGLAGLQVVWCHSKI